MMTIESKHNSKFKRWASLLESKGIRKEGCALVSGEKLVRELLENDHERIEDILIGPKHEFEDATFRLSGDLYRELDVVGTKSPIAVVRVEPFPEWKADEKPQGLQLVLALQDPSNLGAVLRSADAFGISRVILTRECASPYLPRAIKAASLSTFRVKIAATSSALAELPLRDGYALDMDGSDLSKFEWPKDLYLVIGEEGRGVPENLPLKRLKIPMGARTESLNATVAASIAMFSYSIKG